MIDSGQDILAQDIIAGNAHYAADAGSTDAYAVSLPAAPASYTDGLTVRFKANTVCTGPSTLNVNSLGAIAIKRPDTGNTRDGDIVAGQMVEVVYRGGSFYMVSPANGTIPFFQQDIALSANDTFTSNTFAAGSSQDGSVLFVCVNDQSFIYRFQRDALTGQYIETHRRDATLAIPSGDGAAMIVIGNYLYFFTNDNTNIVCSRFLAADLTGEQVMTVPTVACTGQIAAWTDGVDAYVLSNNSQTTSRRWTVSGTTFTAASTYTAVNDVLENDQSSNFYDGVTLYSMWENSGTLRVNKTTDLTIVSGFTQTTYRTPTLSDSQPGNILINIDATKMYMGMFYAYYDEAAKISARFRIWPVTKP